MNKEIILTGILKDQDLFLLVKRRDNDVSFPGAWEFPGGHLENGEDIKQGLARELKEEIGFTKDFEPIITHYTDRFKDNQGEVVYSLELDFLIEVRKDDVSVKLSEEHTDFKWVKRNSELMDGFIRAKLMNIKEG